MKVGDLVYAHNLPLFPLLKEGLLELCMMHTLKMTIMSMFSYLRNLFQESGNSVICVCAQWMNSWFWEVLNESR